MSDIPQTSITLLRAVAADTANDQWYRFYQTYEGPIRGFVYANYPSLDADDILQETMRALAKSLPNYHYTPDEKGHFRNYLMGIVKHKALDVLRKNERENDHIDRFTTDPTFRPQASSSATQEEFETWKKNAMETAVEQLLADQSLATNTRVIFECVALRHESPEAVAQRFGTTRNNVDQIKKRLMERLRKIVQSLIAPRLQADFP